MNLKQTSVLFFKTSLVCVVYFFAAYLGLTFEPVAGFASLVWPPAGIALVATLLFGYRVLPGIFLAAALVNFITGASPMAALTIGIGNALEAFICTFLLKKRGFHYSFDRLRDVLDFVFILTVGTAITSPTIGVTSLWLNGIIPFGAYGNTWLTWWIGDALGVLLIAPFLLLWFSQKLKLPSPIRLVETACWGAAVFAVSWFIFYDPTSSYRLYAIFPVLIGIGLRFYVKGAALAIFFFFVFATFGTTTGNGPFISGPLTERLFYLQLYLATVSTTAMILGAVVSEWKKTALEAKGLSQALTLRVSEQTTELVKIDRELKSKVEKYAAIIKENSESKEALLNVFEDMEDVKRVVEEEKAKFAALLSSIGDGVFAVDLKGRVIYMNAIAEKMIDMESGEAIGRLYSDIMTFEDEAGTVPTAKRPLSQALKNATVSRTFYAKTKKQKRFPIMMTAAPVMLNGIPIGAVEILHDVTSEKEIEQAKSEFVSLAAHQLRTPLTGIEWMLELLSKKQKMSAQGKKYLESARFSARRLNELIQLLLNVSHIESGKLKVSPEPLELVQYVESLVNEHRILAEKHHLSLVFEDHPTALPAVTDKNLLNYILQNLLSNAIDYTSSGGNITVTLEKKGTCALLRVKDTGIGIPKKDQGRLFEKFVRASNANTVKTTGSGLGLYIAAQTTKLLKGKISFESIEGKGSTFTVEFPL